MGKIFGVVLLAALSVADCWASDRPAGGRAGLGGDLAASQAHGPTSALLPLEQRWLQAIAPVLDFARATGFPLDIIVQPKALPGHTPLAVAFVDGRCKLVLSLRGNAVAQETLDAIPPDLLDAALELMAAHELGHCERYLAGEFAHPPAGFQATEPAAGVSAGPGPAVESRQASVWSQALRREEGYADLVGLAWSRHRHPQLYARLHAWLVSERSRDPVRGGSHDTQAWLRLARDGTVLADPSMFSNATRVWRLGLQTSD